MRQGAAVIVAHDQRPRTVVTVGARAHRYRLGYWFGGLGTRRDDRWSSRDCELRYNAHAASIESPGADSCGGDEQKAPVPTVASSACYLIRCSPHGGVLLAQGRHIAFRAKFLASTSMVLWPSAVTSLCRASFARDSRLLIDDDIGDLQLSARYRAGRRF